MAIKHTISEPKWAIGEINFDCLAFINLPNYKDELKLAQIKFFTKEIFNYIKIPTLTITTLCPHSRLVIGEIIFCEFCKDSLLREIEREDRKYYFMPQDFERYEYNRVKMEMGINY